MGASPVPIGHRLDEPASESVMLRGQSDGARGALSAPVHAVSRKQAGHTKRVGPGAGSCRQLSESDSHPTPPRAHAVMLPSFSPSQSITIARTRLLDNYVCRPLLLDYESSTPPSVWINNGSRASPRLSFISRLGATSRLTKRDCDIPNSRHQRRPAPSRPWPSLRQSVISPRAT